MYTYHCLKYHEQRNPGAAIDTKQDWLSQKVKWFMRPVLWIGLPRKESGLGREAPNYGIDYYLEHSQY